MSQAYSPGLKLARRIRYRVCRRLPLAGQVLVEKGQWVSAQQVVARAWLPGQVTPINVAHRLGVAPAEVPGLMQVEVGQSVQAGQILAQTRGLFGLFRTQLLAPSDGTIETISAATGQVILRAPPQPVELLAYLAGQVTELLPNEGVSIEAEVALVQGIFGVGGEAYGPIRLACQRPDQPLLSEFLNESMRGAVVVGGGRVSREALQRACQLGLAALVTGGIDDEDLRQFLGYDLGVAITGSESLGLTLIITEGFGDIAMQERTWRLLASHEGHQAAVNGTTQIRAGVIRPEVVIPLRQPEGSSGDPDTPGDLPSCEPARSPEGLSPYPDTPESRPSSMSFEKEAVLRPAPLAESSGSAGSAPPGPQLQLGTWVRIIRAPYFGQVGRVAALPSAPELLPSGVKARVVEVELLDGQRVVVPRANVEWIEED